MVELKGPNEPILRSREQTPGSGVPTPHRYRLGKELAHALPQALAYRDRLSRHTGAAEEFHGIRNAREPRLLIVLGRQSDLADHERLVLLELNRSLHRAEVFSYLDWCERGRPSRPRPVLESVKALAAEPASPATRRVLADPQFTGDLGVRDAIRLR